MSKGNLTEKYEKNVGTNYPLARIRCPYRKQLYRAVQHDETV